MILLSLLKTLGVVEWTFWAIVLFFGIKGYIEYPNILKQESNNKKSFKKKPSFQ